MQSGTTLGPEWIPLIYETNAAADLLRHADQQLQVFEFAHHDMEPLLAVLATGAERLLKMTYGVIRTDETGSWPSVEEMKKYGHKIAELDQACRKLIRDRAHLSTAPGDIEKLLKDAESDQLVPKVLATLQRYATEGRFYNLDHLAEREQLGGPPRDLWQELEQAILDKNPELAGNLGGSDDEFKWARHQMNLHLRISLTGWRTLYASAWKQGVCGAEAKQYGHVFTPD